MLKYVDTKICFAEVPDEITLCINISNCPCYCKGCHSSYLAEDIGEPLNEKSLCSLLESNKGITCISFMGGDADPEQINRLAVEVKMLTQANPIKVAWYSGREVLSDEINLHWFNYIKLGPYKEEYGPLNNPSTNQRFYKVIDNKLIDITNRFWKNETKD